jgi:hypothetical protein
MTKRTLSNKSRYSSKSIRLSSSYVDSQGRNTIRNRRKEAERI